MAKIKGCRINSKTRQVIEDMLENETRLNGKEIRELRRKLRAKCLVK